jgi:hypothetical protein
LVSFLRARGTRFLELKRSEELFVPENVDKVWNAYYFKTNTSCRIIYYELEDGKWRKRLREISFSPRDIDPVKCVLTFRKIAKTYGELLDYEPNKHYTNGIYTYYKKAYKGYVTVLDMNSAYLYALKQPLADWQTKTECTFDDVYNMRYDFFSFENDLHCEMFYKHDYLAMLGASMWADVKIYGYKASIHYEKTADELYRLKTQVNKYKYKNIANIAVGCMHKHSGNQNNTTLAASLYAWFAWHINDLVVKFEKKGYNVIMVTTDSIKIKGKYNPEDNLLKLGNGLGEFKVEYEGEAEYISTGHYKERDVKWKGKPQYMIDGYSRCTFVDNIEKELEVYEKYAIK